MIRFYILPIERTAANQRGPKYFSWRYDPNPPGIDCQWSMKDYGSIDMAILAADIADADHTALVANSDVLAIPINLDSTFTASARNAARTFLATYNIPATWIVTGMTYRTALRTISGFFFFFQRVNGILGRDINLPTGWLDLQVQNIPVEIRTAMSEAATSFGYDYSAVTGTTTMRTILKNVADQWGTAVVHFGFTEL